MLINRIDRFATEHTVIFLNLSTQQVRSSEHNRWDCATQKRCSFGLRVWDPSHGEADLESRVVLVLTRSAGSTAL
jgi:hypothetical protein